MKKNALFFLAFFFFLMSTLAMAQQNANVKLESKNDTNSQQIAGSLKDTLQRIQGSLDHDFYALSFTFSTPYKKKDIKKKIKEFIAKTPNQYALEQEDDHQLTILLKNRYKGVRLDEIECDTKDIVPFDMLYDSHFY